MRSRQFDWRKQHGWAGWNGGISPVGLVEPFGLLYASGIGRTMHAWVFALTRVSPVQVAEHLYKIDPLEKFFQNNPSGVNCL